MYLCVFAAAASIFTRIIYVNKVYPSVKIHNYNIGDTVNTDEYQICLDSVKVYEKALLEILTRRLLNTGYEDIIIDSCSFTGNIE